MRLLRGVMAVAVCAPLMACRPDSVDLRYRFEEGAESVFRMEADASSTWDIGTPGEGSYRIVYEVTERIEELDGENAVVAVTMEPLEVEESGLPAPGRAERSFALRVGPNGEVLEVLEVDGVAAAELDPDELTFIGTYRPPLPLGDVRLRGSWESEQQVSVGTTFQQLVTLGELVDLGLEDGEKTATLGYEGDGPLVWTTSLPQGDAELTGSASTSGTATFGIDSGALQRAESRTRGRFEVRVLPEGGVPVTGTLELFLELRLSSE